MTESASQRTAAILLALVAVGLVALLVLAHYGVAAEYGRDAVDSLMVFAVLPLAVAALAAGVAGWSRPVASALGVFCVLTVISPFVAAGSVSIC